MPYSAASQRRTSSSLCMAGLTLAKAAASTADNCLVATMRSSNCFNGESGWAVSFMANVSFSRVHSHSLLEQTQQGGLRFLFYREHLTELRLCLSQLGFLGLLRSFIPGQCVFDLRRR